MKSIKKQIVIDEEMRPVAVLIDYLRLAGDRKSLENLPAERYNIGTGSPCKYNLTYR